MHDRIDIYYYNQVGDCCIYSYIQGYVVIMMVEFGEYGFIK